MDTIGLDGEVDRGGEGESIPSPGRGTNVPAEIVVWAGGSLNFTCFELS